MTQYKSWTFPSFPTEVSGLLRDEKKLVIVGVIGKSAFPDCNKMAALGVLDRQPSLMDNEASEGKIQFYYKRQESILFVHFETTFDAFCMQQLFKESLRQGNYGQFSQFNKEVRNRFARMLLFATQVCHIVVFVEVSVIFDASLLAIFKALKIIREKHVLKFLPKLIKNSNAGCFLGKCARLCSPRFLFLFENYPDGYEETNESISKLEFEVEDNIYKMLRSEFIITNNSSMSLFSIPGNKRFVYYNTDKNLREDPLLKSIDILQSLITKSNVKDNDTDDLKDMLPFQSFGKPTKHSKYNKFPRLIVSFPSEAIHIKERSFMTLLKDHVDEAFQSGFDDSLTKFKGKNNFMIPSAKPWFETFKLLHKIFIENPDNPTFEANDPDYKSYLENFDSILDIDEEFFAACCDIGLQKAYATYNNPGITHYSHTVHKELVEEAVSLYMKYSRGPNSAINEATLRQMCDACWENGKQQCEYLSLRRNPCIMPKHSPKDPKEHSSGHAFVSTCNCGRTQGRREDPYTIEQANYEFYEFLAKNCNLCAKVKKITFAIFEPSINDYRAAEFETAFPKLSFNASASSAQPIGYSDTEDTSQPLTASLGSHTNLSLDSMNNLSKIDGCGDDGDEDIYSSSDESLNELIIQVKNKETTMIDKEHSIYRQPSTTEYLPGMVHTQSPSGLLPQFPSWSLVCVGPSSVYSHNTGLLEHFQSGFLSGANFLLPWDVHVRLEHSSSWAAAYEKSRYRKMGEVFILKIFVGCEYECSRGHRFMMSSPDKVLCGGSCILRDSGSKVVYNNMPLYFPCPCRNTKSNVAQLMRVHVVTPKAPVNVIMDPKVRTGGQDYVFTMGLSQPPKLTQSAYWILRLPYIYQGDDGPIAPPTEVTVGSALNYGCLLAGMYGVSETEVED